MDYTNIIIRPILSEKISKLSEIFKTNISINISVKGKGKIVIPFKSESEFKKINKKLNDL